jgi:predicted ABC-type ATPase
MTGGHNIPEEVIRRRFNLELRNLENIYKPLVDTWILYDNSDSVPRLIGEKNYER